MKMNIAIASSREYAYYNKVLLLSLFENNKNHEFTIYYGYIEDNALEVINELGEWACGFGAKIIPTKIDCSQYKVMYPRYMKNIAFVRPVLYWLLPETVDRILYISTDMLVLGDISEFYNIDLYGKTIAGTVASEKYEIEDEIKAELERYKKWNIKRGLPCVESRLMTAELVVIDVKRLKEKYGLKEYIDIIGNKELPMGDEQALNIMFREDKRIICQTEYCVCSQYLKDVDDLKEVRILHYGGMYEKAWNNYGMNGIADVWWSYAVKTDLYTEYIKMAMKNLSVQREKMVLSKEQRYSVLDRMFTYMQSGDKEVYKLFNKVILYGYGVIGKRFITELEKNDVEVSCIIDLGDTSDKTIPSSVFFRNQEKYTNIDAIIITSPQYEQQIRNDFEGKTNIPIISINDFYKI